jgi:plasmid stabilization system protein ParE
MSLPVTLAPRAIADLEEISTSFEDETTWRSVFAEFRKALALIEEFPEIGHHHAYLPAEYRTYRVHSWLIVYRLRAARSEVARVVPGRRDLLTLTR